MNRKSQLVTPIIWYGGKTSHLKHIIPLLPNHRTYVEVFGGSGAVLLAKQPSDVEVFNDINHGLVNFFRVLRDQEQAEELFRLCNLTLYSREEYLNAEINWSLQEDPVQKAYLWFIVARQSFAGKFGASIGYSVESSSRMMANKVSTWLSAVELLPEISQRLRRVQIECQDFRIVMKSYDKPETLFYLDPPYLHETRRDDKAYPDEMSSDDHNDLIQILLHIKGKVILSGYQSKMYATLEENGWHRQDYEISCVAPNFNTFADDARETRTESLWINDRAWKSERQISLWENKSS